MEEHVGIVAKIAWNNLSLKFAPTDEHADIHSVKSGESALPIYTLCWKCK